LEKASSYKNLIVWQKSIALVTDIYKLTEKFPSTERYGIISQLTRAIISIPSNIAEGWGRELPSNYLQFLRIARGSLMEAETIILISKNLKYIEDNDYLEINKKVDEVGKILQGLIKSVEQKKQFKSAA
jgi:four helix bundle protein